jgi:hypothetical protein
MRLCMARPLTGLRPLLALISFALMTVLTAYGQAPPSPVTVSPSPWFDPSYGGIVRRIIDHGTITVDGGYEVRGISTELGSVSGTTFTPHPNTPSSTYTNPPVSPNQQTFTYGTGKPNPVPNPMPAVVSWTVTPANPPNPPHPAGSGWGVRITLEYRNTNLRPPGPWQKLEKFAQVK